MKNKTERLTKGLAFVVILINVSVLFCWQWYPDTLGNSLFRFTRTNPLTAFQLILSATWLLYMTGNKKEKHVLYKLVSLIPFFLFTSAAIKITQIIGLHHFKIDAVLFTAKLKQYAQLPYKAINSQSLVTPVNFILLAVSMLLVKKDGWAVRISNTSTTLSLITILFSFWGVLFGNNSTSILIPIITMAHLTTFSFLFLTASLIILNRERNFLKEFLSHNLGGYSARKLVPYAIFFPFLLTYLRLTGQKMGLYDTGFGIALQAVSATLVLVFIMWRSTATVNRVDAAKIKAEENLKQQSEQLIESIKNELKEKNKVVDVLKEFQFLANMIPQCIWTANADGEVVYYNQHWYDYTGLSFDDSKNWGWEKIVHPADLQNCIERWKRSVATGEEYKIEYRLRKADGSYRWHIGKAFPFKDENGKITKWFGSCTDIHDYKLMEEELLAYNKELTNFRKLAVEELKEKSQFLNGILKNLPVIVYRLDAKGFVTESIGSGLKILGLKDKQMVGMNAYDIYAELPADVSRAKEKGYHVYEGSGVHDGKEWHFESYMFPDEMNPGGVVCFIMDITDKKLAERKLLEAKRQAETASEFKTRFLASMSHELRTPLNAVIGFSKILKSSELSKEQEKEYLGHIESSGNVLLKLIGDILDLSKIEEGKLNIHNEPFHFTETIQAVLSPYRFKANENGLEFSLLIDPYIPTHLIGDAHRINQVLINLVGNALKFTKEGKISVVISQRSNKVHQDGELWLQFSIQDSGIGISEEKQKIIFESFTQADGSIVREYGGSGLGLTIVKQLISLMGGTISAKTPTVRISEKGGLGSLFEFAIPLKISNEKECRQREEALINSFSINGLKVLVAEDNLLNQKLAVHTLCGIGCNPTLANNGQEAIEKLLQDDFDLVLMDVQMPLMDGYEATKIIRTQLKQTIPVIGLTANAFKEDREACLNIGMNDHLSKPYSSDDLKKLIIKHTSKNKMQKQS